MLRTIGGIMILGVGVTTLTKPPKPEHHLLWALDLGFMLIGWILVGASWTRRRWIGALCGLAALPLIGAFVILRSGAAAPGRHERRADVPRESSANDAEGDAIARDVLRLEGMRLEILVRFRNERTAPSMVPLFLKFTELRDHAQGRWEDFRGRASSEVVRTVKKRHEAKCKELEERFRAERSRIEAIANVRDIAAPVLKEEPVLP